METEALQMTPVRQVHMSATSHLGETQKKEKPPTFGEYLVDSLKKVNALEHHAEERTAALAAGKVEDVSEVIVAAQKAEIAVQLTLHLRDRAMSAYQEIMRMQV